MTTAFSINNHNSCKRAPESTGIRHSISAFDKVKFFGRDISESCLSIQGEGGSRSCLLKQLQMLATGPFVLRKR